MEDRLLGKVILLLKFMRIELYVLQKNSQQIWMRLDMAKLILLISWNYDETNLQILTSIMLFIDNFFIPKFIMFVPGEILISCCYLTINISGWNKYTH